jgi:hypothetical protein
MKLLLIISKSYQELIEPGVKEANQKAVPVKDKGIMRTFKASTELASPN